MIERDGDDGRAAAALAFTEADAGACRVVGVTGAPGAGKSSLVAALITHLRAAGERVAVLAVDPSSPVSGGAVLGDRVRMQAHSTDPDTFVRSMASRGIRGGLARAAPDAVRALAAAGWPWVLVETVGVGQSDVDVSLVADTIVVVVTPGWGDDVQAEKAGILEIADIVVVNKGDRPGAEEARAVLGAMLDLVPAAPGGWRAPVVVTSAIAGTGVVDLWTAVGDHQAWQGADRRGDSRRRARLEAELRWVVETRAGSAGLERCSAQAFDEAVAAMVDGRVDPRTAAHAVLGALDDAMG